jgi:hypothetical protein
VVKTGGFWRGISIKEGEMRGFKLFRISVVKDKERMES